MKMKISMSALIIALFLGMMCCQKNDIPNGGNSGGNNGGGDNGGNGNNEVPENTMIGRFSVGDNQQVRFSSGNLWYNEATQAWRFADHQYDYIGAASSVYSEWIDLFDWNTNGAEHGDLSGWRPLTNQEWEYILFERTTLSGMRFAKAIVARKNGLIIFPDDWSLDSISLSGVNDRRDPYMWNKFDAETWERVFEANGAVFLPAVGWANSSSQETGMKGAYWSATQQYPVIFTNSDLGTSYCSIQEVSPFFKYSVRLVYSDGQGGGNNTVVTSPIVETGEVTNIGAFSAYCSYSFVVDEEDVGKYRYGICWDTSENPIYPFSSNATYSPNHDIRMEDLSPNTTYFVRGYASKITDNEIVIYGEQKAFTTSTEYPCYINGLFSVSESKQVHFSQGNLQYQASTNTWRFAEHQWDYVGTEIPGLIGDYVGGTVPGSSNHIVAPLYPGWIDLFSWGTGDRPLFMGSSLSFVDWGINPISNAGGYDYSWCTLTVEEWDYLLFYRQTPSGIRFAIATVNDVRGLILLPDDWDDSTYHLDRVNYADPHCSFNINIITETVWKDVLETHGAVFLPCGGCRVPPTTGGFWIEYVGYDGFYWSADQGGFINFRRSGLTGNNYDYINRGFSVRLVLWEPSY